MLACRRLGMPMRALPCALWSRLPRFLCDYKNQNQAGRWAGGRSNSIIEDSASSTQVTTLLRIINTSHACWSVAIYTQSNTTTRMAPLTQLDRRRTRAISLYLAYNRKRFVQELSPKSQRCDCHQKRRALLKLARRAFNRESAEVHGAVLPGGF